MDEAIRQFGGVLNSGTVLVSGHIGRAALTGQVIEEVADATGSAVARRFGYAYVDSLGTVTPAGPALPRLRRRSRRPRRFCCPAASLAGEAEDRATSWIITKQLPEYLAEVRPETCCKSWLRHASWW